MIIGGNWFERNHGEAQMVFSNALNVARGNYIARLENNYYDMQGSMRLTYVRGKQMSGGFSGAAKSHVLDLSSRELQTGDPEAVQIDADVLVKLF